MKKKLDYLFWTFVTVLPFFGFLVTYISPGGGDLLTYLNSYSFPWIANIFDDVFTTAFGTTFVLNGYLSYCVMVQVAHCLFDVVVFIPRFAHDLVDHTTHLGRGDTKW